MLSVLILVSSVASVGKLEGPSAHQGLGCSVRDGTLFLSPATNASFLAKFCVLHDFGGGESARTRVAGRSRRRPRHGRGEAYLLAFLISLQLSSLPDFGFDFDLLFRVGSQSARKIS